MEYKCQNCPYLAYADRQCTRVCHAPKYPVLRLSQKDVNRRMQILSDEVHRVDRQLENYFRGWLP